MDPKGVLYKCVCGKSETKRRDAIRYHLGSRNSCMPDDISDIEEYIDTLTVVPKLHKHVIEKEKRKDLSNLSEEEKIKYTKDRQKAYDLKRGITGSMNKEQYAAYLLKNMIVHSKAREHELPNWNVKDVLKILEDNIVYTIETDIGVLEFPMVLTNGYFNSASFDRIDNDIPYNIDNIEIRPHFLNASRFKISTNDIKDIIKIRDKEIDLDIIKEIHDIIDSKPNYTNFFYLLAKNAHKSASKKHLDRNITFDFDSIIECMEYLKELYKSQNFRSIYTNVPIYPIPYHKYLVSLERIDPTKSYCKGNLILIEVGLNGRPAGRHDNINLSLEEREEECNQGKFN